jgi:hypothetical protein
MKTHLSRTRTFGLFFAVAFLALQVAPAAAADSGSGTFVGADKGKPFTVTFNDAYAFRAEDKYDKTERVTVVLFSESPLDKKAITAALKKERSWGATKGSYEHLIKRPFATLNIDQEGSIKEFYLSKGNYNLDRGKSDVKVNSVKRVEGRWSYDGKLFDETIKIDLRFATDLADVGPPVKN